MISSEKLPFETDVSQLFHRPTVTIVPLLYIVADDHIQLSHLSYLLFLCSPDAYLDKETSILAHSC